MKFVFGCGSARSGKNCCPYVLTNFTGIPVTKRFSWFPVEACPPGFPEVPDSRDFDMQPINESTTINCSSCCYSSTCKSCATYGVFHCKTWISYFFILKCAMQLLFCLSLILVFTALNAFTMRNPSLLSGHSVRSDRRSPTKLMMGNNAAFGIFSPAVYAAKFILGDAKLNKVSTSSLNISVDWAEMFNFTFNSCTASGQGYFSSQSSHHRMVSAIWRLQFEIETGKHVVV